MPAHDGLPIGVSHVRALSLVHGDLLRNAAFSSVRSDLTRSHAPSTATRGRTYMNISASCRRRSVHRSDRPSNYADRICGCTGHCYEDAGAPPYWPWVQVARSAAVAHGGERLWDGWGHSGAELATIMPEIRSLPGFVEPEVIQDPDAARFRMFDAYAQFMRRLGEQAPLVVVLEDLHWADRPTLQLLQHLARELVSSRVLVIATYRDTDITRASPRRPQQSRAPSSAGRFLGASLTGTSGRRPDGLMAPHRLAAVWRKHWGSTVSGEAIPDASITRRQPRWKFRGLQGVPTPEGKIRP